MRARANMLIHMQAHVTLACNMTKITEQHQHAFSQCSEAVAAC